MKPMMRRTTLREIKNSLGRYLAILAIVALGVGFFAGLRIMEPAMRGSAQQYLKESSFYDFRLLSTLGFTKEDVERIREEEGLASVEGGISIDFLSQDAEGTERVIRAHAIPEEINKITLVKGRMPEDSGECVVDTLLSDVKIGDELTVSEGNSEDTKENFTKHTYTVVGKVNSPLYLNMERGTTSLGNGRIHGFVYFPREAFTLDYETEIYVTFPEEFPIYSEEYEDFIKQKESGMQAVCDSRGEGRLQGIVEEAEEKIADAEIEIADGEQKLADAKEELRDARETFEDGKRELAEKESEWFDGVSKLREGEQELIDALAEIKEGELELSDAKTELDKGEAELWDARLELSDGASQVQKARITYDENYAKWKSGAEQLEQAKKELAKSSGSLRDGWKQYEQGKAALDGTKAMNLHTQAGYLATEVAYQALSGLGTLTEAQKNQLALLEQVFRPIQQALQAMGITTPDDTTLEGIVSPMVVKMETQLQGAKKVLEAGQQEFDAGETQLQEAEQTMRDGKSQLDFALPQLEKAELELAEATRQVVEAQETIDQGKLDWEEGALELADAQKEVAEATLEIEDARVELADGKKKLEDAKVELAEGEVELLEGEAEYKEESVKAESDIADAKEKIADAKEELSDLEEPEYYVLGRDTNIGYVCYENDSGIVQEISKVFPLFFFMIAALVCMTTMNRMVEEQRTQIGVLKALGYSSTAIMAKYVVYAGSAALLGCVLGFFGGVFVFPTTIWQAYSVMYEFTDKLIFIFDGKLFCITMLVSLLCSVGAAYLSCRMELRSVAAVLLRPKAPKSGKRIFLERIPFIWNHLKFLYKVSIRNVVRFKKRFFMMILGISGCSALLVAGFGIKDSIADVVGQQYEEIQLYDLAVYFKESLQEAEQEEFAKKSEAYLTDYFYAAEESADVEKNGQKETLTLITPQEVERIGDFISIHTEKWEPIPYPEEGEVILTEKKAKRLDVSIGDEIVLVTENQKEMNLIVTGIAQNYVHSYAYIHPDTYRKFYGKEAEYKAAYVKLIPGLNAEQTAGKIGEIKRVASVSANDVMRERFDSMMGSLDYIVILVISCAAALAFIVLYNLTNINITERIREIATIKVLGFYPMETAAYVFRENMVLAGIGGAVGLLLGKALHAFVIQTIDIEAVSFQVKILGVSYLYSFLLTILFAMLVNCVMFFKLERINMAESLKSIE